MATILAVKEMQIKITLIFYLTPIRIATTKNTMWEIRNPHTLLVGV
jgi:hypothetical protein